MGTPEFFDLTKRLHNRDVGSKPQTRWGQTTMTQAAGLLDPDRMNAIVVYESVYGNTRDVAAAIAAGMGSVPVLSVKQAQTYDGDPDLIVVGGPTHIHGVTTKRTRRVAIDSAHTPVEPSASEGPGVRDWLHGLEHVDGLRAAAFDTRAQGHKLFTGAASRGIARRLRHHGYDVIDTASFLVADTEGPLQEGELDRARAWGAKLAGAIAGAGESPASLPRP